ncbi:MAG: dihydrodipicolinate synthase family protein [Smithellaceae bacterium]|nr:dihydrodipicolinate synthase family protein [Smithellaceae bacterium]
MADSNDVYRDKLTGVFAPVTTPFDEKGNLLQDKLAANIRKLNESRLRGYLVLGTNGEFKSLTESERRSVMETVKAASSKDKIIMVGTGRESTHKSILASREAAYHGADFVSLLAPSFFPKRMIDPVLSAHFRAIADVSTIPVLLYNNPEVGIITLGTGLIGELSKHPNIVGMKDSSNGNFASYLLAARPGFHLLAGSANFFLEALFMGGSGGVLSIANFAPDACCLVYELWLDGKIEEAKQAQYELMRLNHKVSGRFGVAGVKAAMELAGLYGGPPRAPLVSLTLEEKDKLASELKDFIPFIS